MRSEGHTFEADHVDHAGPHPVWLPTRDGVPAAELLEEVLAELAVALGCFLSSQDATAVKLLDLARRAMSASERATPAS